MSNMKQVVYAGAFGALVAMQGCGTDEPAQVTSEGTTAEGKNLQQSVDEVVEAAQEKIAQFDSDSAIKKVKSYLQEHNVDLENIADHTDVESMTKYVKESFEKATKSDQFNKLSADLTKMLHGFVTPAEMDIDSAEKFIKDACPATKKGEKAVISTQADAAKFVMALQALHKAKIQGQETDSSDVTILLKECKSSKWNLLPCLNTSYKSLTAEEIKTKQGYNAPAAKGAAAKKAPKVKSIYDVMPTDFRGCTNIDEVLTYIAGEVNNATSVNKAALMELAQGLQKDNLSHKKTTAVKAGKKVADEPKEEKVEKVASNASASTNASTTA